jgi:hypothetical protein
VRISLSIPPPLLLLLLLLLSKPRSRLPSGLAVYVALKIMIMLIFFFVRDAMMNIILTV